MSYNIFMSGKVTGDNDAEWKFMNYKNIISARMRELGYDDVFIWNPIEQIKNAYTHEEGMFQSLMWLTGPDATGSMPFFDLMVTLPGAGTSKGSRVEQMVAQAIGLTIMTIDEFMMADDLP